MPYENYSPEIPVNDEIPSSNGFPEPDGEQQPPREKAKKGKKQPASKKVEKKKQAPKPSVNLADSQIVERLKALATSQNLRLISGLILSGLGLYLLIVFISYFSTCIADQSQVDNIPVGETVGITNAGGEGGARIGEFLINGSFGLGSVVIVFWLIAMGLRNLIGYPRFKSVNFTIKCLIALITTSLIIGLLNVGFNNTVNWGGVHGRYVNERIIHYIGWSGAVILSLVMLGIFVLICLRDVVKWIIRLKRKADEKRREIMEARAEAKRRRDEIEEMRRREAEDAAKSGEAPAPEPENIVVEQKSLEFGNSDTHFENGENYVIPDELPEDNSYSSLYGNPRPVASEEATQASLDSTATEKDINDEGGYALPDDDVVESTMTEHVVREAGHESADAIRQTETATEISGGFGSGSRLSSGSLFSGLVAAHVVDELDSYKDTESNDDEVDNSLDPGAPVHCNFGLDHLLAVHHGFLDNEFIVGEVHAAGSHTDQRHDNIVNERRNDFAESGTDDHADCHVDHIAFDSKFLEFFEESHRIENEIMW